MKQNCVEIPSALAAVAAGRDHISTREFAHAFGKAAGHVRKLHSVNGEAYGIRPLKVGRDLLWPVVAVAMVLTGAEK